MARPPAAAISMPPDSRFSQPGVARQQNPRPASRQGPAAVDRAQNDEEGHRQDNHLRQRRMAGGDELREQSAEKQQHFRVGERHSRRPRQHGAQRHPRTRADQGQVHRWRTPLPITEPEQIDDTDPAQNREPNAQTFEQGRETQAHRNQLDDLCRYSTRHSHQPIARPVGDAVGDDQREVRPWNQTENHRDEYETKVEMKVHHPTAATLFLRIVMAPRSGE